MPGRLRSSWRFNLVCTYYFMFQCWVRVDVLEYTADRFPFSFLPYCFIVRTRKSSVSAEKIEHLLVDLCKPKFSNK